MLRTILTILQLLSAFAIIGLVLLQRGKGADAGAGFGAGASGTVFGARGATTGLSRMTAIFAAIFMLNSLCLTYLFQRDARAVPQSILEQAKQTVTVPAPAPAAPIDANAVPVPATPAEQAPKKP
jgi:preprotein translocase subunit SecG